MDGGWPATLHLRPQVPVGVWTEASPEPALTLLVVHTAACLHSQEVVAENPQWFADVGGQDRRRQQAGRVGVGSLGPGQVGAAFLVSQSSQQHWGGGGRGLQMQTGLGPWVFSRSRVHAGSGTPEPGSSSRLPRL